MENPILEKKASFGTEQEEVKFDQTRAKNQHRMLYLLPNSMTSAALFSGFYAILTGARGDFVVAAIAIFVAMVLDIFDGRVARLTNTSTPFGEQYDSLSDMVAFGLAPAVVVYHWALFPLSIIGAATAFAYAVAAALRLARFNTQIGIADKRYFSGLPSPLAAAVIAGMIWVGQEFDSSTGLSILAAVITLLTGILMVSNIKYQSFKGVNFKGRGPFVLMSIAVILVIAIAVNPPVVLLSLAIIYASSGPLAWMWRLIKQ